MAEAADPEFDECVGDVRSVDEQGVGSLELT
jgi:hypothetical protein